MTQKYYLDTCIWRDYFENRSDNLRPLGDWAHTLIKKIRLESGLIIYSDLVEEELFTEFDEAEVKKIISIVPEENIIRINSSKKQFDEALSLKKRQGVPVKDALHAILARDNGAIFVTRDKHLNVLADKFKINKPEELI